MPVTSGVNHALRAGKAGADVIASTGMEAGGHVGELATLPLIPQVVDAVKIPVIAGGGIADGRGLAAALALGAGGIQMGTRLACTVECGAHINYKQKIVEANDRATVVMGRAFNDASRGYLNSYAQTLLDMEKTGATREDYIKFNANRSQRGFVEGDTEQGRILFGQIAGLIRDMPTCQEVIERTVTEALEVMARLGGVAASASRS
jgi:enoyl-[acyl-carrier protein] reductase II